MIELYIMYVDESGVEEITDDTKYFVTSGVIIHENSLADMKEKISEFKNKKFLGNLEDAEIHVHEIFKGKKEFYGLTPVQIKEILDELYNTITKIPFSTISVVIDKPKLKDSEFKDWDILETGYTFLIERFDKFLRRTNHKGIIRIDKTSNKVNALNAKDNKILDAVNKIRKHGTNWQSIKNIAEEPYFIDSHLRKGLQVADAVVYCVNRHMNQHKMFDDYWDMILPKMHSKHSGSITGFGLTVFPK